ncbi:MAG: hypothetical protein U5L95_04085 [Candidatus Saccharibacteria bacterium]|nr:hypothetical protein [Candidatus Saccharibacteria bacterium]
MNLPLYTNYSRKLDAFIEIKRLNSQFLHQMKNTEHDSNAKPTWLVEMKILKWIDCGHKKLGSLIDKEHLGYGNSSHKSKLDEFKITETESQKIGWSPILGNLVERGLATSENIAQGIKFKNSAYVYSQVINEAYKFANSPKEVKDITGAGMMLKPSYKYYSKYINSLCLVWYLLMIAFLSVGFGLLNVVGVIDSVKLNFNYIHWWIPTIVFVFVPLAMFITVAATEIYEALKK